MSELVVVVVAQAKPGQGGDAVAAFQALAVRSHAEEGCRLFARWSAKSRHPSSAWLRTASAWNAATASPPCPGFACATTTTTSSDIPSPSPRGRFGERYPPGADLRHGRRTQLGGDRDHRLGITSRQPSVRGDDERIRKMAAGGPRIGPGADRRP